MPGEKDLAVLLKSLKPVHVEGDYVFCSLPNLRSVSPDDILCLCREAEGISIVVRKEYADQQRLSYTSVMAWITLTVHSSLDAVGMTAAFSKALGDEGISCNVVAGFYHDHIFVGKTDAEKAMTLLKSLKDQIMIV